MRLDERVLNRATLARQSLLERARVDPLTLVERVAGFQAQEPATPYIAAWARLEGFDPDVMSQAVRSHDLVKAPLHRSTLHLVTADGYSGSIAALTSVLRTRWMGEQPGRPVLRDLPELADAALAYACEPRTNLAMRDFAGTLGEPVAADELWRRIRRYGAFLMVPGDAVWSFDRRPVHIAASARIEREPLPEDGSLAYLVRSHLRAFGPARMADVAQWSGLGVKRLMGALSLIDDLEEHEDAQGRALLDLAGSPLPDGGVAAPARLLPMWDETLLAYQDRSRLLPAEFRKRVIAANGDVRPTFILDGLVAGLWWTEPTGPDTDARPRIIFEPFRSITGREQAQLDAEGERLADFLVGREPSAYARYRR